MMTWLHGQAKAVEMQYAKPDKGGARTTANNDDSEEENAEPTRGIGFMPKPQKNKQKTI